MVADARMKVKTIKQSDRMRDEDEMDMLEIYIQHRLEHFNTIPEQTGNDALLIDIFKCMLVYMKELRTRLNKKS